MNLVVTAAVCGRDHLEQCNDDSALCLTCTVHNLHVPSVTKDPSEVAAVTFEPVAPCNLADCRQGFGRNDR